jgi:uncharacterized protein DUF5681
MPDDYEVGYGKPPKSSQFSKGVSGNPRGRPKGAMNRKTLLHRALSETVVITENGKRKRVSKREAIYKQLVNKSVGGDLKAIIEVNKLTADPEEPQHSAETPLSPADQENLESILERMKECLKESKS